MAYVSRQSHWTSIGNFLALFDGRELARQDAVVRTVDDAGTGAAGTGTVKQWPTSPVMSALQRRSNRYSTPVADSRNEPSFNPAMTGVELLTPLPIGLGTRFRAHMGKAGMEMLAELTEFERPYRLGSRTTSSMMETSGRLTFTAEGDGTVMSWDWQVRPKGWLRMLGPLSGILGGRMERRIWTGLKDQLEDSRSVLSA